MNLVDRARNILTRPRLEWPVIAAEPMTVREIFTGYAMILALLPLIGGILIAFAFTTPLAMLGLGPNYFITSALVNYVVSLAVLYVVALIAEAIAPSFGARKSRVEALKWIAFSVTPMWIAGLLVFVPVIGALLVLAGLIYGIYLLYLGAGPVMGAPEAKAGGLTAAIVVIWIVVGVVANMVVNRLVLAALFQPVIGPVIP